MTRNAVLWAVVTVSVVLSGICACSNSITPTNTDGDLIEGDSTDGDDQPDGDLILPDGDIDGDMDSLLDGDIDEDIDLPLDGDETDAESNEYDDDIESDGDIDHVEWEASGRDGFALAATLNQRMELLPGSIKTQLHPYTVFDGDAIWMAYNIPNKATGGFEVWATRLGPQGNQLVTPFKVSTTDANCLDPAVAVSGETVFIAWQCDTGESPVNLYVFMRAFTIDGAPLSDSDFQLQVVLDENAGAIAGNAWMPDVTRLASGGFVIASAFAAPDATGFQILLTPISETGEISGPSRYASPSSGSQVYPSIAAAADGQLLVSWNETTTETEHAAYSVGTMDGEFSEPVLSTKETNGGSKASLSLGGLLIWTHTNGVQQTKIELVDAVSGAELLSGGISGALNHTGQPAIGETAGTLMWVRTSGSILDSQIFAQRVEHGSEGWGLVGNFHQLNETKAPGYFAPSALAITDDVSFLVWAEGKSPDFVLYGKFLNFDTLAP